MPAQTTPKDSSQEDPLVRQLRRLIEAIEVSGRAVLPQSDDSLLSSIVEAAARIFGAAAASILLINEKEQVLEFKVSFGEGDEDLIGMSLPLDKGIAGYVAMTGQPIAVSDVKQDARFNQDFAKSTGYVPDSILATPLIFDDRVIGVMEVLDKFNAPSFGIQDMELLCLFANQAAIAIHQAQQVEWLGKDMLRGFKDILTAEETVEVADLLQKLDSGEGDEVKVQEILALADTFNAISTVGEAERKTCLQMLELFANYARSKAKSYQQRSFSF
jgi:GAF domain-containing protein